MIIPSTPAARLPELLSRERFIRIAAHAGFVADVVGDRYAVLVLEVDQLDLIRARHGGAVAAVCDGVVSQRLRETIPSDAIASRLREDGYGMLAFGATTESLAFDLATALHARMRAPIHTHGRELLLSVSVGLAFTRPGVRAIDALRAAERAVIRVRQNGGDATFMSRVAPPPPQARRSGAVRHATERDVA